MLLRKKRGKRKLSTLNVTQQGYSLFLNGKEYTTREQLCQDFKMTEDMLAYRLNTGMTLSEALSFATDRRSRNNGFVLEYDGLVYSSLKEFCHIHKMDYHKTYNNVKKGISLEDIITNNIPRPTGGRTKKLTVNGYEFSSIKEACDYFGICTATFRYNRKKGLSVENSLIHSSFKGKEKYTKLDTMKKGELQNA